MFLPFMFHPFLSFFCIYFHCFLLPVSVSLVFFFLLFILLSLPLLYPFLVIFPSYHISL
jgi:hypothetical protein